MAIESEDSITSYGCTNAIFDSVLMAVIIKANNPGCFRLEKSSLPSFLPQKYMV